MMEGLKNWIPIDKCEDGRLYQICARNASYGIYRASEKGFEISRFKFGDNYTFTEYHWDTGAPYGTVKPMKKLEEAPELKTEAEKLEYLNKKAEEYGPVDWVKILEEENECSNDSSS